MRAHHAIQMFRHTLPAVEAAASGAAHGRFPFEMNRTALTEEVNRHISQLRLSKHWGGPGVRPTAEKWQYHFDPRRSKKDAVRPIRLAATRELDANTAAV